MLALVAYSFETGQIFRPMQTDATLLVKKYPTMLGVVGTCCVRLHGPLHNSDGNAFHSLDAATRKSSI